MPPHATQHYVFHSLSAVDLERALRGLGRVSEGLGHVAIDSLPRTPIRGQDTARQPAGESPGVHMLQAFSTRLSATVGSLVVPPDSAEMVEALKLIKSLPLAEGDVASGDAAFAYGEVAVRHRSRPTGEAAPWLPAAGGKENAEPTGARASIEAGSLPLDRSRSGRDRKKLVEVA